MLKLITLAVIIVSLQVILTQAATDGVIQNCAQVSQSGIYTLKISHENETQEFKVLCDEETLNGGWTVVLMRHKGGLEMWSRDQEEYRNGFGKVDRKPFTSLESFPSEFFIGLQKLHLLTSTRSHALLFVMEDFKGDIYKTYLPEFELEDDGGYKPIFSYEGVEIGMPHVIMDFENGWKFDGKYSPKTNNHLNIFGPYCKIGEDCGKYHMGFYNDATQRLMPLKSIKMLIRPVNMFRKSFGETFAKQFHDD